MEAWKKLEIKKKGKNYQINQFKMFYSAQLYANAFGNLDYIDNKKLNLS